MAISKAKRSAAAKRRHEREKETLPLKLQKEVQPQGEESVLPVRKKAALREKVALREKHLREKVALREENRLRNEEGNQSFRLKTPFFIF